MTCSRLIAAEASASRSLCNYEQSRLVMSLINLEPPCCPHKLNHSLGFLWKFPLSCFQNNCQTAPPCSLPRHCCTHREVQGEVKWSSRIIEISKHRMAAELSLLFYLFLSVLCWLELKVGKKYCKPQCGYVTYVKSLIRTPDLYQQPKTGPCN